MAHRIDLSRSKLPSNATKFIGTFLRFEFALKDNGYAPKDGDAFVEWGRVTKDLGRSFLEHIKETGKADTILNAPPKKQIANDHVLGWKDQNAVTNVDELFRAVRGVRNNLLHGGKSGDPDATFKHPNRNAKLIAEAQWIIEQALLRMNSVRASFEGQY